MVNKHDDEMNVTISGGRLPMIAIAVGFTALVSSVIFATIWITRLDNRVYVNTNSISEIRASQKQHVSAMTRLQSNCAKQTFVLDALIKRVEKLEK